ncbi:phage head spike fiber domain-containing protein [Arenimonas oryziterrae]|uniref:Uncharacterized protein n=1 Tax=Arenimonas oryziterrae DSM 21050 = YC6267 TaxID=1121015 RepID=A0A091AQA9_9GAMM|nr:hypothetical protein [Arenimonas oryziterrae]KFN42353.1 hypothetical protein N789_14280 [Arenimonas oryziterrae DSM 21050 = YC6267]
MFASEIGSGRGRHDRALRDLAILFDGGAYFPNRWSDGKTLYQDSTGGTPVTAVGQAVGLIIDKLRSDGRGVVNYLTFSNQLDNSAWTKNTATITANAHADSTGAMTLDKVVETAATSLHGVQRSPGVLSVSAPWVISFEACAAERTMVSISDGGSNALSATYDLAAGTVLNVQSGYTASITATATTGVYLCTFGSTSVASPAVQIRVSLRTTSTAGASNSYLGVAGSGLYLGRFQFEKGSAPTSYQDNGVAVGGPGRHLYQSTATARGTLSGTVGTLGSELVTDGDMSAQGAWTTPAGIAIAGGVMTFTPTGAANNATRPITVTPGETYQFSIQMSGYIAGTCAPSFQGGTATSATAIAANGTVVFTLRAETGNITVRLQGSSTANFTIDNVSVKQVLTWTGPYGIVGDGVDDNYAEANTHAGALPMTMALAFSKDAQSSIIAFGSALGNTDCFVFLNVGSSNRFGASLRHNLRGVAQANSGVNDSPIITPQVATALATVGSNDIQIDNKPVVSIANTWLVSDSYANAKIRLGGTSGAAFLKGPFFGGIVLFGDAGADGRAHLKSILAKEIGTYVL